FASFLPANRPGIPAQRRESALRKLPAHIRGERDGRAVQAFGAIGRRRVGVQKAGRRNPVVTFDGETAPERTRRRQLRLKPCGREKGPLRRVDWLGLDQGERRG